MTGCIDNDEPYGIEQIRLATADFLKSKQALAAAEAEAAKAKAEVDKANAEIAKIEAEIAKMQAESAIKIAEAEAAAKLAQTQAEAEEAQARADMMKAKVQAYIDGMKAKIDRYIAETQNAINWANLSYEQALHQWELDKIKNAEAVSNELYGKVAAAYDQYFHKLYIYNQLNQKLVEKQQASARWMNNLEYQDGQWVHPQDKLKDLLTGQISELEGEIASQEETIAGYNEKLAELKAVTTGNALYLLYQKYEAELKEVNAKYAEATVKLEEEILKNEPLKQEVDQLYTAYEKEGDKEIAIAPYKYEPNNAALPGYLTRPWEIVEGETYTLNEQYPSNYDKAVQEYEAFLANLKRALLDDNDIAWTTARLNEMQREIQPLETAYAAAKKSWQLAKEAYNMGNEPKASVLPNAADIDKAIADYVAAGAAYEPLLVAYNAKVQAEAEAETANNDAQDELAEAQKKYNMTPSAAQQEYDAARAAYSAAEKAAAEARDNAEIAASDAEINANKAAENAYKTTINNYQVALKNLNAANAELALDPTNETLQAAATAAEGKLTEAELKAFGRAAVDGKPAVKSALEVLNDTKAANAENRKKSEKKADVAYKKAEAAAFEAFKTAENKFYAAGGYQAPKDNTEVTAAANKADAANKAWIAAKEATVAAQDALVAPGEAVTAAYETIGEKIDAQETAISFPWDLDEYNAAYSAMQDFLDGVEDAKLPTIVAPVMVLGDKGVYENAKDYLITKSQAAYGRFTNDYTTGDSGFDAGDMPNLNDEAFLLNDVTVETINKYIEAWYPNVPTYLYGVNHFYDRFGAFGVLLSAQDDIQIAKAYLSNNDLYNQLTATAQANLDKLEADNKAAKDAQEAAYEAYEVKKEELQNVGKDIKAEKDALEKKQSMIQMVINAIDDQFQEVNDFQAATPEKIDQMIKGLSNMISVAEEELAALNASLKTAQDNLTLLENGKADYTVNPYTADIELLTAKIAVAKEALDFCKKHLEELQAKYEAAANL